MSAARVLYLADMLIASPELFDLLTVPTLVERSKTLAEKQAEALQIVAEAPEGRMLPMLRRYKNDEIWRIALRNILGNATLPTTTEELSDVAEAVLQAIYPEIDAELRETHGTPLAPDGTPATFAIVAMGKFGGRELNFSSDLDVMYVYSADGETTKGMPNVEFFEVVGLELVNRLAGNQGMGIYEIDLRLRPHGRRWCDCTTVGGVSTLLRYHCAGVGASGPHARTRRHWRYGSSRKPVLRNCTRILLRGSTNG